jgi:hypothetical protein
MRYQSARVFLEMVGGQPMVFRPDEVFEKQPGGAGQ